MNIVAILANGVGSRFQSNIPKQFHRIEGKMIIEYVLDAVLESKENNKIVIASNISQFEGFLSDISKKYDVDIIEGGTTRNRSLGNVLQHIALNYKCEKLIVCDSVRPMISGELLDNYYDLLDEYDAVVTANKITDSLGSYDHKTIDRERYYLMQSPEGFRFDCLQKNFDSEETLTEVTHQLPEEAKIFLYFDFVDNIKITYPHDLVYLQTLLRQKNQKISINQMLQRIRRLNSFLRKNYEAAVISKWENDLGDNLSFLLAKWGIDSYQLIKTSHFGIVFLAGSSVYGKCAIKFIPPFIDRYDQEKKCYQVLSSSYMCEIIDFDDQCSALLLRQCDSCTEDDFSLEKNNLLSFFANILKNNRTAFENRDFHDYRSILYNKINEKYEYKAGIIQEHVNRAAEIYRACFESAETKLLHGDVHRYNIMTLNGKLFAIDPIGYIAPPELEVARYIGTEINECKAEKREFFETIINYFSEIIDKERLKKMLYTDIVFRMHNSLFENEDYTLTDQWLDTLDALEGILWMRF